jgi:FkbM family methyltransferase
VTLFTQGLEKIRRYRQVRAWHARQARDDIAVQRLLEEALSAKSNCVDVGAHRGEFLDYFTDRSPEGQHIAIEALPHLAVQLRKTFPQVLVVEAAVADKPGSAIFYHAVERPAWSGLEVQEYPTGTTVEEIPVTISTLDDIVPDPATVDFVKIDVEGAELGVLQGMHRILSERSAIVLFEHAIIHAKAHSTTPAQIFDTVAGSGYLIYGLDGCGPHDRQAFIGLCESADRSGYGRDAQTNWVACPPQRSTRSRESQPASPGRMHLSQC